MNFLGKPTEYNHELSKLLTVNATVISYFDGYYTQDFSSYHNVLLFPINSKEDYIRFSGEGFLKMIDSGFTGMLKTFTSIFLYLPGYIKLEDIADTINNLDLNNLVDTIHIYPKVNNYVLRDNKVENLPFQKLKNNTEIS